MEAWLEGVEIVDLSRLVPGPACTWYLQGMGARVVKVEEPGLGDYLRAVPPFDERGIGAWYAALNAGKRSVALDLRREADREAFLALLGAADVLVESFRPGVLARLGLAPEALRRRFPRLVIASITGFGQRGPWRDHPGHDLGYQGLAGALALAARHDGVPDLPGVQVADIAGGALTAAMQVAAALYRRERTGEGDWLDVSITEGALALVLGAHAQAAIAGRNPTPGGEMLTGGLANYGIYACADGGLVVAAPIEPRFQEAFRRALGEAVPMEREALAALFRTRPRDAWVALLGEAAVSPLLELDELAGHPVHRARGSLTRDGRRVRPPGPGGPADAIPCARLGEHTAEELSRVGVDPTPFVGGRERDDR